MTAQDSVALMGDCHLPRLGIFHPHTRLFGIDWDYRRRAVHVFRPHLPETPPRAEPGIFAQVCSIAALPAALSEGKRTGNMDANRPVAFTGGITSTEPYPRGRADNDAPHELPTDFCELSKANLEFGFSCVNVLLLLSRPG